MKLDLRTLGALLVSVAGLLSASLAGAFTAYPTLMTVVSIVVSVVTAAFPKLATSTPPAPAPAQIEGDKDVKL